MRSFFFFDIIVLSPLSLPNIQGTFIFSLTPLPLVWTYKMLVWWQHFLGGLRLIVQNGKPVRLPIRIFSIGTKWWMWMMLCIRELSCELPVKYNFAPEPSVSVRCMLHKVQVGLSLF
jgi:hypothetical protein